MAITRLHMIPVALFVVIPMTFIGTYIVAVWLGHVEPYVPYISDTGTRSPESCVFGQIINMCAVLLSISVYVRYCEVYQYCIEHSFSPKVPCLNKTGVYVGLISSFGLSIVANFQETNVFVVHIIGAFMCFGAGTIYFWIQAVSSYHMYPIAHSLRVARIRAVLASICSVLFFVMAGCGVTAHLRFHVTIDTVEELAKSPVKCGGWGEENKKFFTSSLDPASREIGKKFEVVKDPKAEDSLSDIADGTFAYYSNIFFLRNARVKQWLKLHRLNKNDSDTENTYSKEQESNPKSGHNLHIMSDCVINMPVSIGLQKNSPLKPQVDKFIRQFIEAGLIKKWLNDVMMNTLIAEAPLLHEEVKALVDLKKLYAGFIALFSGCIISIVVLLLEIIHWNFIVKKDPLFDNYFLSRYYDSKK